MEQRVIWHELHNGPDLAGRSSRYRGLSDRSQAEMTPPPTVSRWAVEMPFPAKELWPNGRSHWAAKARATKRHRGWAKVATLSAKVPKPEGRMNLRLIVHPRTSNRPDADNCIAAAKCLIDGIADALGVDDSTFNAPTVTFGMPAKGGKLFIELSPE